jgi:hypothetical protein
VTQSKPTGKIDSFFGLLAAKTTKVATLEEINEAAELGWAGQETKAVRARMGKDRAMATISVRFPEDVIEDLKEMAPRLGFLGYQALLRAYVGQGLRADLLRLEGKAPKMEEMLRRIVREEIRASQENTMPTSPELQQEAAHRLALLGGTMPDLQKIPRRRQKVRK